jgi:diguanylate cyclase (GGDEF)-like protein
MEKFKRINEIQCNLIKGDISEKSKINVKKPKTFEIITFKYNEKLTGGFLLLSNRKLKAAELNYLELIKSELDVIYKVKYMFNEQKKHALTDTMTGLYTRQEFDNMLDLEFHKARRYIFNFSLAILDVDYLSKINEKYGREFGDFVLSELSSLLKRVFRRTDPIYRYGSEELIIFLPFTPITKALIPIERLRTAISDYVFEKDGTKTNITVSVGLCANYSKFTEPEQMLEGLGTALTRAKERGRNKVDIFE